MQLLPTWQVSVITCPRVIMGRQSHKSYLRGPGTWFNNTTIPDMKHVPTSLNQLPTAAIRGLIALL